jgi:hypothetical protein
VSWDLSPGSYDRALPERLDEFARARKRVDGRARPRRLDTGPPDGLAREAPDDVLADIADELAAEHELYSEMDAWWGVPA